MPVINGTPGNDTIAVAEGDSVYGFAGNDTFAFTTNVPRPTPTLIDGGDGYDILRLPMTSGAFTLVLGPNGLSTGLTLTSIEQIVIERWAGSTTLQTVHVTGTDAREVLYFVETGTGGTQVTFLGGGGDDDLQTSGTTGDYLDGGDGNDRVFGRGTILGGAGNDTIGGVGLIRGGDGNDRVFGSGQLLGDDGDDELFMSGNSGQIIYGGNGVDTLVMQFPGYFVESCTVDLTAGTASFSNGGAAATLTTIENVRNDSGENGLIRGNASANGLTGGYYVDTLYGMGGDDILDGLEGADFLYGGDGNDTLFGGSGNDTLDGGAGRDRLSGGPGLNQMDGGAGDDVLVGGLDADVILGGDGADILYGGGGADRLTGGAGDDYINLGSSTVHGQGGDAIDGGAGNDTVAINLRRSEILISTENGVVTIRGPGGNDTLVNVEHLVLLDGVYDISPTGVVAAQPRLMTGTTGADRLTGTSSVDVIQADAGSDVIFGGRGNDIIDGGAGIDTAAYAGIRRQYDIFQTQITGVVGQIVVAGTYDEGSDGDGVDTLIEVETLSFVDGTLTFDGTSAAAQVMRLYSAALNRTPDQAGLEANVAAYSTFGLQGLANNFVGSAEFQNRFGALNNVQFVEQLYVFALGRTGDNAGVIAWVNALESGMSRAQVLVGFSESGENQTRTAATLAAGLWMPDAEANIIARMYDATLDRLPDPGGLVGWVALYDGGMSLVQIAASFSTSPEFQARYGALSNQQFIEQLYRFCLNREGDAPGVQAWVDLLNNGTSRAQVVVGFSESPEHIALTAPLWSGGIRYAGGVAPQPAPLETSDAKGLHDAQVLPGDIDGQVHDPADLWLVPASKDHDAFVLPADPDGSPGWGPPVDDFMFAPLPAALPPPAVNDLHAVMPPVEMFPGDPAAGIHRNHLDLAWA